MAMAMDDTTFLHAFEATTLTPEQWDHRAHIRMGFLYIRQYPFDIAIARIRRGIKALNQAHQKPDTEFSGYHETLTIAWAWLIAAAISRRDAVVDFEALIAAHPQLLDTAYVWRYYSPRQALTPTARQTFVEPDRQALPALATPVPKWY
jgi:hypothetical protein